MIQGILFYLLFFLPITLIGTDQKLNEKHIVVLMVDNGAGALVQRAMSSIFSQHYTHYTVLYMYTDYADNVLHSVQTYVEQCGKANRVAYYANKGDLSHIPLNSYAQIRAILQDDDIVIFLSPYDFFIHNELFTYINRIYQSDRVWMTYGPQRLYPSLALVNNIKIPDIVCEFDAYRNYLYVPCYAHTCLASLLKKVQKNHFFIDNQFIDSDDDLALMLPMLEMAKGHIHFVSEPLVMRDSLFDSKRCCIDQEKKDWININIRAFPAYKPLSERKIGS